MSENLKGLKRTHMCGDISLENADFEVTLTGWVHKKREMSKRNFIILRDRTGIVQVVCDETLHEEIYNKSKNIKTEYVIAVKGIVAARTPENINKDMKTGEIEIEAKELRVLSESETPPFHVDDTGVSMDQRLKYRYLDLRKPELQKNLMMRHKVANVTREFLNDEGFIEIETPMLTKSSPEGARDYLVPSRVHNSCFYALPQSPQMFKQVLMVSGLDRYYQIVKCFRDEDLRADRQPEFTQIDMELSFVDEDDVMDINERLICKIFKKVLDVDVPVPFKRLPYAEAMERYGSDKPDLRFSMELVNISAVVNNSEFAVFKNALTNGGSVRGINAKGMGNMPRKKIDALTEFVKTYKAKGLAYIALTEEGEIKSPIQKFFTEEKFDEIIKAMNGEKGDLLLFCADDDSVVFDSLGNLRVELAKQQGILNPNEYNFLWVTDFPLLEYDDEANRYVAIHHPFTSPKDEDLEFLDTDPLKCRAKAYDMVLNGVELGGGSIRIYNNSVQEKMFGLLGHDKEASYERFGFLLESFKYGVPPHGGLAFGFDRIIMLMVGAESIRDVIAFPKVKDASCPMTGAPDVVADKQLEELSISVVEIKE